MYTHYIYILIKVVLKNKDQHFIAPHSSLKLNYKKIISV